MSSIIESKENFETQAGRVLGGYRDAIADLVQSAAVQSGKGADLERSLGLDKTLAWKVSSAASCAYPFDVARHIPGKSAINILIKAGRSQGVDESVLGRLSSAYQEYESLIKAHAGDRATLEMMLLGFAEQERGRADREYRKTAFRANSYLFGIQARAVFRSYMLFPSATHEEHFDCISIRGHIGLRRLRTQAPWIAHRPKITDDQGQAMTLRKVTPIDPDVRALNNPLAVPWMHKYCSDPIPDIRRVAGADGRVQCEVLEGEVGNTGVTSFVLGEMISGVATTNPGAGHDCVELAVRADIPVEKLILDQFIHRDLLEKIEPTLSLYSELSGPTPPGGDASLRHRIPIVEQPAALGDGGGALHCADIPRYGDILRDALGACEIDPNHFVVHRSTIEFPPIPSSVVHRMGL